MAKEALCLLRPHVPGCALPSELGAAPVGDMLLIWCPSQGIGKHIMPARRRQKLLLQAQRRQAWLEALMPLGTVLPLHPRINASGDDLSRQKDLLRAWMNRLAGRVQFQLEMFWNIDTAVVRFADAPELKAEENGGLNRLARRLADQADERLEGIVRDSIALPVSGREMLLNKVILVQASAEAELDDALARIDAIWPEGLRLRLVGPSPAVSFALLSIREIPRTALHDAAEALGVFLPARLNEGDACHIRAELGRARRRALLGTADRRTVAQAAELLDAALPALGVGVLPEKLMLLDMRRDGTAGAVGPSSLPGPDPEATPIFPRAV